MTDEPKKHAKVWVWDLLLARFMPTPKKTVLSVILFLLLYFAFNIPLKIALAAAVVVYAAISLAQSHMAKWQHLKKKFDQPSEIKK